MNTSFTKIALTLFSCLSIGFCEVITVKNYTEIEGALKNLSPKSLLLIDIDYVLVQPKNPILQMGSLDKHHDIVELNLNKLSPSERDMVVSNMLAVEPSEVLTPELIKTMNALKKKHVTVLGISSELDSMKDLKLKNLKKFKIKFSAAKDLVLTKSEKDNKATTLKSGVLFTDGERRPRGDVLSDLFKSLGSEFESLVYISDKLDDCKEVEDEFKKSQKIKTVTCYHYPKALDYPKVAINPVEFEKQFVKFINKAKKAS